MRSNVTTIPSREGISKKAFILLLIILAIGSLCFSVSSFAQGGSWTNDWSTPKVFIENKGQFPAVGTKDGSVLYAFDDNHTLIYFKKDGFDYQFLHGEIKKEREERIKNEKEWIKEEREEHKVDFKRDDIHIKWENSNSNVEVISEGMVEDHYNYAVKDDDQHQHGIDNCRAFKKLTYKNIYDHIDLEFVFHPTDGIKYSFIVHPGGDPSQIKMDYSGMDGLSKNKAGEILIKTIFGDIVDHIPTAFYQNNSSDMISSEFTRNGDQVSFSLGNYDNSKTIVIDPWQQTSALGFGTTAKIWECEHDNASNSYFWGGAFPKVLEKKFNNAGTLQWTYNSPWDTSGFWIGTFIVDNNGVSYTTGGSNGEISKVSTAGAQVWYNNPNGLFGPLFEYWHISFNCDQTSLMIGGMRAPNPFSIGQYRGVTITINMGSGAVTGFTPVGYVAGLNIKEVRTICTCPSGGYYYLTLDSVGKVNAANVIQWQNNSTLNFSYGNPSYSVKGNMGMSAIRANANFIYTQSGNQVQKRSTANGAIIGTAPIPGGIASSFLGTNTFGNSGLDIDSCGNVYVGSGNQIVKYDANLVQLSTQATPGAVYDVSVSKTGQVVACGNSFIGTYAMGACAPMQVVCITSTLAATATSTNPLCNGQCTGTATANPTGGTSPYTYVWSPGGQTTQTATGLCAGSYTCSVSDAAAGNTTVNVTITAPTVLTATQSQVNLLCNGVCNGTASVVASGGTAGYTYVWSPSGGTATNATGLCSGNYTCTITDAHGCTHQNTFVISQPTVITSTPSSTTLNCSLSTATASVTASGGTGTYTYSWSPVAGTNTSVTVNVAGNYTCTITDANGCTHIQVVTVVAGSAPTITLQSQTNLLCNGATTGAATVTATGTSPFTYAWSPSGGTNANATGLGAGTYTITVTDATGCPSTLVVTITQPTAITGNATSTPTGCSGNTGTASINASGGTGTLTYVWTPSGGTNSNATGLGAGSYTVTVTDANGCTHTSTTTVTSGTAPTLALQSQTNILCNGSTTGVATMLASGGQSPYTYVWTPSGGTNANATGLGAGTYTCTVTDANGCTQTQIVTITQPTIVSGTTSTTNATCGNTNGSASVVATGGNGPYTYSWAPSGGSTTNATGLGAGIYTVYITDANGCTQTATAGVSNSNGATVTLQSQINLLCNGGSNGSATVTVTGGTSPYTYAWSPTGGTNATATGMGAGTYTVSVTDAGGCTTLLTVTITQPTAISGTTSSTPTGCSTSTGTASVNASGGTGPYTYVWAPSGGTGTNATGLAAGIYTVTITDANGCTQTATSTVLASNAPTSTITAQTNVTCNGNTNGSVTINVTGGTGPYTYVWTPSGGTNANATGLGSGTYTCTITDANGCTATQTVTITQPIALAATTNSVPACGTNNGTASVTVTNGTAPYTYAWSPSGGTNANATGLSAGTYTVTVTDANGCTTTSIVTVVVNAPPVASTSANVTIVLGNGTTLTASGGGTYSWSNGATNDSITVSPTATTTYCVYVTNLAGCVDSSCVTVSVDLNCGDLWVPNAFSPNGDGANDTLFAYGTCIKIFSFVIYDRWGEKVFETTDITKGWDGHNKDGSLVMNTAVFVYRLEAELITGESKSLKGNITLVR